MNDAPYILDDQFGFVLRQVLQRYVSVFAGLVPGELTPPQFGAIVVLYQNGPLSQNELGRRIATDGATIKGIVDRLTKRGITQTAPDKQDRRMLTVSLTPEGAALAEAGIAAGPQVTEAALSALSGPERVQLMESLKKLLR
jgi:DNA-binding MarR family transcriptional regulator